MQEFIILLVGFLSGFLGATVGGGGLISVPALLLMGFPPHVAVASKKVGDVGVFAIALREYWKSRKIDWKKAKWLMIIATIGSLVGSQLMILLSEDFLTDFIVITIIVFLPFIFLNRKLGIIKRKVNSTHISLGYFFYFLVTVIATISGGGGALVILFTLVYFFGYKMVEGHATNIPSEFILSIIPALIYFLQGYTDAAAALLLFIGSAIGGYIGSRAAITKGDKWVRGLFISVIVFMIVKIIFF